MDGLGNGRSHFSIARAWSILRLVCIFKALNFKVADERDVQASHFQVEINWGYNERDVRQEVISGWITNHFHNALIP